MDMVTELVVEEIKIQGGQKIRTAAYKTPNKVLYSSMYFLGKALRWLLECKSNNMTRAVQPRDIRALWQLWNAHKADLALSQKFSDAPTSVLEFNHLILFPHPAEMQRYKNIKIQRVANEIHNYAHVCMTRDSADGTHIYHMADFQEILEAQVVCEELMKLHIGSGEPIPGKPGEWDTGIPIPALTELGNEEPTGDLDIMMFAEPSKASPGSHLPDAPDVDGEAPAK